MLEEGFLDPDKPVEYRRHDLPHWRQNGALYFVTFRLADSIPQETLRQWQNERLEWERLHPNCCDEDAEESSMKARRRLEQWLDRGYGSCVLRLQRAKGIVEGTLRHFDGVRYELGDYAIAANHVHALVRTADGVDLSKVLYSWKRYSANRILKLPEVASGWPSELPRLWQPEPFDHIVRNVESLDKFRAYIRNHDVSVKPTI